MQMLSLPTNHLIKAPATQAGMRSMVKANAQTLNVRGLVTLWGSLPG